MRVHLMRWPLRSAPVRRPRWRSPTASHCRGGPMSPGASRRTSATRSAPRAPSAASVGDGQRELVFAFDVDAESVPGVAFEQDDYPVVSR